MAQPWNPYARMRSVFDPAHYYGRRTEASSILGGVIGAPPKSFLVRGFKLIGKTSLWQYVAHEQGARREFSELWASSPFCEPGKIAFIYANFHRFNEPDFLAAVYERAARHEAARGAASAGAERGDSFERLKALLGDLQAAGVRPVICLDDFDGVVRAMTTADEANLSALKDRGLAAFVVLLEHNPADLNPACDPAVSCFFRDLEAHVLELLSPAEARELVTGPLRDLPAAEAESGAAPAPPYFSAQDIELALRLGGRHPRLLIAACEGLFSLYQEHPALQGRAAGMRDEAAEEVLERSDAREVMAAFWGRLEAPEREALRQVARGEQGASGPALRGLARKKLLLREFDGQGYAVFAELFRDFALEAPAPRAPDPEALVAALAPLDQRLLAYLRERADRVCPYREIYEAFWEGQENQAALSAAVSRIRARLREASRSEWEGIRTVRGAGYQYAPPESRE